VKTISSTVFSIFMLAGALSACASDAASGEDTSGAAGSTASGSTTATTSAGSGSTSAGSTGAGGAATTSATGATGASTTSTTAGTGGATGTGGAGTGGGGATDDAGSGPDSSAGDSGGVTDAPGPSGDGGWPGMVSIFDGQTLNGWDQSSKMIGDSPGLWSVVNGVLHGNGTKRGSLSTKGDYKDFRFIFSVRHGPTMGGGDHVPCVLIWGYRPPPNDALGGIQFQPPNGGSWDYRPGKNNSGNGLFTHVAHTALDNKQWNQCEILAHGSRGEARMACCTLGTAARCKGVEVLRFKDPTAGNNGPIGLQVHNAGLHDEYKDLYIEVNPAVDDYLTTH
jgi:hypothetical protein